MGKVRFLIVAVSIVGAFFYLVVFPNLRSKPRVQPMRFSHKAHVEEATCEACHVYVMELAAAGTPTLKECLDCHDGVQSEKPEDKKEEKKLEIYAKQEREIPWVRLPSLDRHTYFSHFQHATLSKIKCETCHGDIAKTSAIPGTPAYKFTMKWCLHCHEERKASTDCLICHR